MGQKTRRHVMKYKLKVGVVTFLGVAFLAGICVLAGCEKETASFSTKETKTEYEIWVGEVPIDEYSVVGKASLQEEAVLLQNYIYGISGVTLPIAKRETDRKNLILSTDSHLEQIQIEIEDGEISILAPDKQQLKEAVYVFANTYLGYAFAGEERESILQTTEQIRIPENVMTESEAWMPEREPIVCLWKTDDARGIFSDDNVSMKSDVLTYSDEQLYEYVKMMKHCGFTGIQVTDMCSAWANFSGYEFVHQRLRYMADAAHSMGMKFTLWVWGAEFNGYGWVDDTVVYYDYYKTPYSRECPEAVATFEKYYTIYAELADCSDRIIMHFNDPGNLQDSGDIGYYAAMFRDMCREKNPEIDFGVNCYTQQIDLAAMKEFTGEDVTVYSTIPHNEEELQQMWNFRQYARDLGLKVGVWSWNLGEMEIDQIAEMNVNAKLIAESYRHTRTLDEMVKPTYWSEMDSYHMLNLFSLYVEGHLLQNPDMDPQAVLQECAVRVVGEEYAPDLLEVLNIIQDARTGDSWKEFKYGYPEYLRTSDLYPAQDILTRSEAAIPKLQAMIDADLKENTIPMAISTKELLSLILPHLVQIRDFAQFRVDLADLEEKASGMEKEVLAENLREIYTPIQEYNVIIGAWGQPEANAQYELVIKFCATYELDVPHDPVFDYYRKQRVYGEMIAFQKKTTDCYKAVKETLFQGGNAYGAEETARLTNLLIEDGLLLEDEDGLVYLSNWENYRYR